MNPEEDHSAAVLNSFLEGGLSHCVYTCCMLLFQAAVSWLLQYTHRWNYLLKLCLAPEKRLLFKMALTTEFQPHLCWAQSSWNTRRCSCPRKLIFYVQTLNLKEEMSKGDLGFFIQNELATPVSEILNRCEIAIMIGAIWQNCRKIWFKRKKKKKVSPHSVAGLKEGPQERRVRLNFSFSFYLYYQILMYTYTAPFTAVLGPEFIPCVAVCQNLLILQQKH